MPAFIEFIFAVGQTSATGTRLSTIISAVVAIVFGVYLATKSWSSQSKKIGVLSLVVVSVGSITLGVALGVLVQQKSSGAKATPAVEVAIAAVSERDPVAHFDVHRTPPSGAAYLIFTETSEGSPPVRRYYPRTSTDLSTIGDHRWSLDLNSSPQGSSRTIFVVQVPAEELSDYVNPKAADTGVSALPADALLVSNQASNTIR